MTNESLYLYKDGEYGAYQTLLLTDEQASVFKWLENQGYDFVFEKLDNAHQDEINTDLPKIVSNERLIEQTWDLCREIMNNMTAADARNAGLIEEGDDIAQVFNKNTYEKARWRYNLWKERTSFKAGDVVKNKVGDVFIVINITDDRNYFCLKFDLVNNCSYYCTNSKDEMQHMVMLGNVDFFTKGQGE